MRKSEKSAGKFMSVIESFSNGVYSNVKKRWKNFFNLTAFSENMNFKENFDVSMSIWWMT
jgi:hypothetical protein